MKPPARLAAFAVVLAAVFGLATLAGGAVDPAPRKAASTDGHGAAGMSMSGGHAEMAAAPRGLSLEQDGDRLALDDSTLRQGRTETLRFRTVDEQGEPVREFEQEHGARLHLIIARRDLTGYQHLHPRLGADGTWSVPLTLPDAGAYRVFADFKRGGEAHTLAADLFVDGAADYAPLPAPAATADTGDGYQVSLA